MLIVYCLPPTSNYGTLIYLCICKESSHLGCALMNSIIEGVICIALSHSGCRYSLHFLETVAEYFSAHSKSDLLKMIIFNSSARGRISGKGALNFFGETHIQSQLPVSRYAPDVSRCVL